MFKSLINIGILNSETNYIKLAIELCIFLIVFAVLTAIVYKQTRRKQTIVISIIYLVAGLIACLLALEIAKYALVFSSVVICCNLLLVANKDSKFNNRSYIQTV